MASGRQFQENSFAATRNTQRGTQNSLALDAMEFNSEDDSPTPRMGLNSGYHPGGMASTGNHVQMDAARSGYDPKDFVDSLVVSFALSVDQASDLLQISKWGAKLDLGTLLILLSLNANHYRTHNLVASLVKREDTLSIIAADLKRMLEKNWEPNSVQNGILLSIAKDIVISPNHTDYKKLGSRLKQTVMGRDEFQGVFDNPHRLKIIDKEITKKARHIRNQFRIAIKETTFGEGRLSLDDAVTNLTEKFLLGGVLRMTPEHTTHITLLRRFARDNMSIICDEVDEVEVEGENENNPEIDEEEDDGNDTDDAAGTSHKRRRTSSQAKSRKAGKKKRGGRVPKGKDWWSLVETWFKERRLEWGVSTDGPQWKSFILESINKERRLEKSDTVTFSDVLPRGPVLSNINISAFNSDPSRPSSTLTPSGALGTRVLESPDDGIAPDMNTSRGTFRPNNFDAPGADSGVESRLDIGQTRRTNVPMTAPSPRAGVFLDNENNALPGLRSHLAHAFSQHSPSPSRPLAPFLPGTYASGYGLPKTPNGNLPRIQVDLDYASHAAGDSGGRPSTQNAARGHARYPNYTSQMSNYNTPGTSRPSSAGLLTGSSASNRGADRYDDNREGDYTGRGEYEDESGWERGGQGQLG